jgi:hypothetical protein
MRASSIYAVYKASMTCAIGLAVAAAMSRCEPQTRKGPRTDPPPVLEDPRQQIAPGPDIGVTPPPQPEH